MLIMLLIVASAADTSTSTAPLWSAAMKTPIMNIVAETASIVVVASYTSTHEPRSGQVVALSKSSGAVQWSYDLDVNVSVVGSSSAENLDSDVGALALWRSDTHTVHALSVASGAEVWTLDLSKICAPRPWTFHFFNAPVFVQLTVKVWRVLCTRVLPKPPSRPATLPANVSLVCASGTATSAGTPKTEWESTAVGLSNHTYANIVIAVASPERLAIVMYNNYFASRPGNEYTPTLVSAFDLESGRVMWSTNVSPDMMSSPQYYGIVREKAGAPASVLVETITSDMAFVQYRYSSIRLSDGNSSLWSIDEGGPGGHLCDPAVKRSRPLSTLAMTFAAIDESEEDQPRCPSLCVVELHNASSGKSPGHPPRSGPFVPWFQGVCDVYDFPSPAGKYYNTYCRSDSLPHIAEVSTQFLLTSSSMNTTTAGVYPLNTTRSVAGRHWRAAREGERFLWSRYDVRNDSSFATKPTWAIDVPVKNAVQAPAASAVFSADANHGAAGIALMAVNATVSGNLLGNGTLIVLRDGPETSEPALAARISNFAPLPNTAIPRLLVFERFGGGGSHDEDDDTVLVFASNASSLVAVRCALHKMKTENIM